MCSCKSQIHVIALVLTRIVSYTDGNGGRALNSKRKCIDLKFFVRFFGIFMPFCLFTFMELVYSVQMLTLDMTKSMAFRMQIAIISKFLWYERLSTSGCAFIRTLCIRSHDATSFIDYFPRTAHPKCFISYLTKHEPEKKNTNLSQNKNLSTEAGVMSTLH